MKRLMIATLATLVVSALVSPRAQAIRPELLPKRVHPSVTEETTPSMPTEVKVKPRQEKASMEMKLIPEVVEPQQSEVPPFEYFERIYLDKYGS